MPGFNLENLAAIIAERARAGGDQSYTRKLLDEGIEKCAKKLGEEATETVVAALSSDKKAVIGESADLLYHLLVVLEARGVKLDEVYAELERRTGNQHQARRSCQLSSSSGPPRCDSWLSPWRTTGPLNCETTWRGWRRGSTPPPAT